MRFSDIIWTFPDLPFNMISAAVVEAMAGDCGSEGYGFDPHRPPHRVPARQPLSLGQGTPYYHHAARGRGARPPASA